MLQNADGTRQNIHYGAGTKGIADERGNTTGYAYRAYGNPDQSFLIYIATPVVDANILIKRNTKDLVEAVVQGGIARGFGYDANYYLRVETNPETGTTVYGRDVAGNMKSRRVGASGTTFYTYDGLNRLKKVTYPDTTPSVTNVYNKTNRLLSTTTADAVRSYSYDGNGNLLIENLAIDSMNFSIGYAYNGNDQLSAMRYPSASSNTLFSPDILGRPTEVSGYVSGVSYWPSGQINQINYTNGTSTNYGQNSRLWPSTFSTNKTGTGIYFNSSNYAYDGTGNLNTINDTVDSSYNRSLVYDEINRLRNSTGSWGGGNIGYSGSGNISYHYFTNFGMDYTYDANNRLSSISGSKVAGFAYDNYGNITADGTNIYTYNAAPNLSCVNCNSTTSYIRYQYDGTNHRVSTTKAGVKTYEMYDSQGKLIFSGIPSGKSLDMTEYYYLGGKRIAQKQTAYQPGYISNLSIDPNPAVVNKTLTLTARVGGTSPTGKVTFYDGNRILGTATVINGVATITFTFTSKGSYSITASYFEDFSNTPTSSSTPYVLPVIAVPPLTPVIRYRNTNTGAYLLTASTAEINTLPQYPAWVLEGPAYDVFNIEAINGISPVYRFRTDYGGYFYTIYKSEKDAIIAGYPSYYYEGIAWYAMTTQTNGTIPIYRFFTPATNTHFFTASEAEKDYILANLPWLYEGISQYVWPYGTGIASRRMPIQLPLPH